MPGSPDGDVDDDVDNDDDNNDVDIVMIIILFLKYSNKIIGDKFRLWKRRKY